MWLWGSRMGYKGSIWSFGTRLGHSASDGEDFGFEWDFWVGVGLLVSKAALGLEWGSGIRTIYITMH